MGPRVASLAVAAAVALSASAQTPARTLDIYFIDVEGGQSTLVVTPQRQSLLVDTGFAGSGGFDALPGDPAKARDAQRVLAAARDAGVKRLDYVLMTHFHADHNGGIVELASLLPIGTFVDHGSPKPEVESVPGSLAAFERYAAVRAKGKHLVPKPGDRVPLKGVELTVVSALEATIAAPLAGSGRPTPGCAATPPPAEEKNENPRSTGFRLQFGRFRFLDVGDLAGAPLFALACPADRVGPVDVYLVAHHGGLDAADPATFAAFRPRVAVMNNGATKGGAPETFATLQGLPGIDTWQLHRSTRDGSRNFGDERIANLDETTAHWIKVSARADGSFTVTNARTGAVKNYPAR